MTPSLLSLLITLLIIILLTCFHGILLSYAVDYDFSYMKSVVNATDLPLIQEYDYIVIGGGTTGCPIAATLSENYSVLVLERGNVPKAHPNTLVSSGFVNLLSEEDTDDNTNTPAQRFTSKDGVDNVRGRVLGGSSMINAGFFSEAEHDFFVKYSGVKWDMNEVEKAYKWVEDSIVSYSNLSTWQFAVKEALLEAGVGPDNGVTTKHKVGTKISGSIFDDEGRRHGAVELLNNGNLKNLQIAILAYVTKIIFSTNSSSHPNAIGVIYTDSKEKSHKALIRNKGEVILSAGPLGSPQLLLLSGIGPKSNLTSQHIPIILSQPNVGQFMADNPRNNLNLVILFPLEASYIQIVGITKDYYIETMSYSLPFFPTTLPFSIYPNTSNPLELSLGSIAEKIVGPLSTGSLWLASTTDVKVTPHVQFNYFSNPIDLTRCVSAMRTLGDLLKTKSLDRFKYTNNLNGTRDFTFFGPPLPDNYQTDNSSMEEYCRSSVTSFWHYHGGCLVGKVVDGDFKVIGIDSLRVVDGSTFTISPGTNPQATLMMIGRYLGVKMLRERTQQN